MTGEHVADVRNIAEDDRVTLTLDDGTEMTLTCDRKTRHHEEGVNIVQQDDWYLVDDSGREYDLCIMEGLSGTEGESAFPHHFPLIPTDRDVTEPITEENSLGYVEDVQIHGPEVNA